MQQIQNPGLPRPQRSYIVGGVREDHIQLGGHAELLGIKFPAEQPHYKPSLHRARSFLKMNGKIALVAPGIVARKLNHPTVFILAGALEQHHGLLA